MKNFSKLFLASLFLVIIMAFTVSNGNSQLAFEWGKQFGSDGEEYVMNHLNDNKGNIIVAGKTTGSIDGPNKGANDGFVMKIDSRGNKTWARQFGTSGDEDVLWSTIDDSGNIVTAGSTGTGGSARLDIMVVKFSPDGKQLWSQVFGTDSIDVAKGICTDKDGRIYITGTTLGKIGDKSYGKSDVFVARLDRNGKREFVYQFGTPGDDSGSSIAWMAGNLYICGTTSGDLGGKNKGFLDVFTAVMTDKGKPVSLGQYGTDGFDIPMVVNADKAGNIIVGGTTSGNWGGNQLGEGDCFLLSAAPDGSVRWIKQFGTAQHDGVRSIATGKDPDGRILVSGLIHLPPADAFISLFSTNGDQLWEKHISDESKSGDASGKSVTVTSDGYVYQVGLTSSGLFEKTKGPSDFYIVKYKLK